MVSEVNNLISNTLIVKHEVLLPGIGTLLLQRKSALVEGRTIAAPSYYVGFSSQRTACCIIDVIAETANISVAQAEDIYLRWRDKVQTDGNVSIGGVGTLRGKTFITDPEFLTNINKDADKVEITSCRRRARMITPILFAFSLVLVLALCLYFDLFSTSTNTIDRIDEIAVNKVDISDDVPEPTDVVESAVESIIEEQPEAESRWYESDDIKHRVVVGSYSTIENAERAARDIEHAHTGIYCSVFTLGKMYAVAVYGSAEHDDCVSFKREHSDIFKQSWIYTPKRFR